ncbi:MAG: hypothetical protein ACRCYY_21270 [Trueperaceae bacterium]
MRKWTNGIFLIVGMLILGACGGSSDSEDNSTPTPTPTPAPEIKIFAQSVLDTAGLDCLIFAAAPSENLQLLSVNISHEFGTSLGTINLGGGLTIPTERLALQDDVSCYEKITGEYRFVFTATRPNDTTQFTINSIYTQANAIRK